jgi:site-specific DNA recombinase
MTAVILRICLYARYSTDLQNDKSIAAQFRELREWVARTFPGAVIVFEIEDAAKSGVSRHQRPGLARVMRLAENAEFDLLVTETPNRLARTLREMSALNDELKYLRVRWLTKSKGEMDAWKIAQAGSTSESQLEENSDFTRRGLRECIEEGRWTGPKPYGYRLDRSQTRRDKRGKEELLRGVLVIDPEQAIIVVRIFRLYAAGMSPKAIAKLLNGNPEDPKDRVAGPRGRIWRASTIQGNATTGVGILNNELYRGRMVHGRRQYLKNPKTGLRDKAIMNPADALMVKDVSDKLRIIDDALWEQVKLRQAATRHAQRDGVHRAKKGKFLFSKLTRCGVCHGGFTTESRDELRCANKTQGACTNGRVIKRTEVERRVLVALQKHFFTKERLDLWTRTYVAERNRLRAERQRAQAAAPRELESVKSRALDILRWMQEGFRNPAWKAEVQQLGERQLELEALIRATPIEPPVAAFHPTMGQVFERKIRQLAAALEEGEDAELRETARQTLRGFIDRIVIPPGDALLQVVGNLGEMLTAAGAPREAAAVGDESCGGRI